MVITLFPFPFPPPAIVGGVLADRALPLATVLLVEDEAGVVLVEVFSLRAPLCCCFIGLDAPLGPAALPND